VQLRVDASKVGAEARSINDESSPNPNPNPNPSPYPNPNPNPNPNPTLNQARFINDCWAPPGLPARTPNCYVELLYCGQARC